ncbi:MAG: hypothetical protein WA728_28060 [Xanthobacteraceae bacterium]
MFGKSRWTGAELHTLVTQELFPFRGEREGRVQINGPAVMLEPNTAQTIAISLHELATNAAKYGSLSEADGDGLISAGPSQAVRSSRRPRIAGSARIMENMIRQMKGDMRFDWRTEGLLCEIAFPT